MPTLEGADVYDEDDGEGGDLFHGGGRGSSIVRLTLIVKLEDVRLSSTSRYREVGRGLKVATNNIYSTYGLREDHQS